MIVKDSGHGITQESLDFWNKNKNYLGDIVLVRVSEEGITHENKTENDISFPIEYNCLIQGKLGVMLLSGCNCGYGGTGPNGTAKILAELGVPVELATQAMLHKEIAYHLPEKKVVLDGKSMVFMLRSEMLNRADIVNWIETLPADTVFCPYCLSVMQPSGKFDVCENEMCQFKDKLLVIEDVTAEEWQQIENEIRIERAREVLEEIRNAVKGNNNEE